MSSQSPPPLASGPTRTSPTISALRLGASVAIEELVTALYAHRYNGVVTLDFRNGRPRLYAIGRPRRGKIIAP